MHEKDGGPAFPSALTYEGTLDSTDIKPGKSYLECHSATGFSGMTLREYFAAAALQGMVACQGFVNDVIVKEHCGSKEEVCEAISRWAYMYADAMLAAREAQ